jgi:hypothetical protein
VAKSGVVIAEHWRVGGESLEIGLLALSVLVL